jgi:hypothetical protein
MPVLLEGININEVGVHEIRQTLNVQVTSEQARRIVSRWLLDQVSDMMRAESPTLVVNGRSVWRVPAVLTAVHVGVVGMVGMVDVDAVTGDLVDAEQRREELTAKGIKLAEMLPPYPGPRSAQDEFIPTDVPPAATLLLVEEG